MNFRILCCIVMGVFTAHLGLFMFLMHMRPRAKFTSPPPPNFTSVSQTVVDQRTGERATYREITVSTKLADIAPGAPRPATSREVPGDSEQRNDPAAPRSQE